MNGFKKGSKNVSWKGDKVSYGALHDWVKKYKPKPKFCECCNKVPPLDLANKTGIYNREFSNWEYLCRRCHMEKDGRNDNLRKSGKSRKLPNKTCLNCQKEFHRDNRKAKFCSRACYRDFRKGKSRDKELKFKVSKGLKLYYFKKGGGVI